MPGDRIPLIGRVLCVADSLDAMASHRAYRMALDLERIRDEIETGAGTQFDPAVVRAVLEHWGDFEGFLLRARAEGESLLAAALQEAVPQEAARR